MAFPLTATYRLQLHEGFTFPDASRVVTFLKELGISHAYTSPYLQAARGSTHGYDTVDPTRVSEDLGGETGHVEFCRALSQAGLGQILDVVPNHMAMAGPENPWWWNVLENGPASPYACYFDIVWNPENGRVQDKVLVPGLGDHIGRVLEAGELKLVREGAAFQLRYYEKSFPLAPRTVAKILERGQAQWKGELTRERLETVLRDHPFVGEVLDDVIRHINEDPEALREIVETQNYRLSYWRMAAEELNYRRFFDIDDLVGLRVEDERVFRDVHGRILAWLADGTLDGVRVDHPDGLYDPAEYFKRLRGGANEGWILAEKILEPEEALPSDWPVEGTTGYEFLCHITHLFLDSRQEAAWTTAYRDFTGVGDTYDQIMVRSKRQVLEELLGSDWKRLTNLAVRVFERHWTHRDYTRGEIAEALGEVVACLPVYRTYVRPEAGESRAEDREHLAAAVRKGKQRKPDLDPRLFDFLERVLSGASPGDDEARLVRFFQQVSGPAMAKGVEDTAFYVYNRFVAANEVGGDPGRFGQSVERFHEACRQRQERTPRAMSTTSTHDTKRSEDVRARLGALSERPELWNQAARRMAETAAPHKTAGEPDRNTEWFFYQNLIGAWPISRERMHGFMEKAVREAKARTHWLRVNDEFERALHGFIDGCYDDERFVAVVDELVAGLKHAGYRLSLSQKLIALTAPGIPDLYQGSELWDFSLVDPDNRRPVDYGIREARLAEVQRMPVEQILERMDEGYAKLWLVHKALSVRKSVPEAFSAAGAYTPLEVQGPQSSQVVAFARGGTVATVCPCRGFLEPGDETVVELPPGRWSHAMTADGVEGGATPVRELWQRFPVALMVKEQGV